MFVPKCNWNGEKCHVYIFIVIQCGGGGGGVCVCVFVCVCASVCVWLMYICTVGDGILSYMMLLVGIPSAAV